MHKVSRTALASVVCPSTPFLLPRCVGASIVVPALCTPSNVPGQPQRRLYADGLTFRHKNTRSRLRTNKSTQRVSPTKREEQQQNLLAEFLSTCNAEGLSKMWDMYLGVVGSITLQHEHTRLIASAIHNHLRNKPVGARNVDYIVPILGRVVQDIRSGVLPPHPYAHVHILGTYKDCKRFDEGVTFWQWLIEQDDSYVDSSVYGAAIELLAYQGNASLTQLESLYAQALKRFPGTFAEYHLSPEAVIPDRSQRTTIVGLPMLLLQGILTARIFSRDWKKAYLALDTALRLYPTTETPSRFFELFIYERPTTEAYTVFLMACRSGQVLRPELLTRLLVKLSKAVPTCAHLAERTTLLRAMANAMYAYVETGGMIEGPHLGIFVNTFIHLLPQTPAGSMSEIDETAIRATIAATAHGVVSSLLHVGMPPHPQAFYSLINLAGALKDANLLERTLHDATTARQDLGEIGNRSVLKAAGAFKNKGFIEMYWKRITSQAEKEGKQVSSADWITLARTCRHANYQDFFHRQFEQLAHTTTSNLQWMTNKALEEKSYVPRPGLFTPISPLEFELQMNKLQDQIGNIAVVIMSGQPLDLRKTPFSMFLDPTRVPLGLREDLEALYEEFTTDPHQPPPQSVENDAKNPPIAMSSTGFSFAELRFQNWVTIMELMSESELAEKEFQDRLDNAIAMQQKLGEGANLVKFRVAPKLTADAKPTGADMLTRDQLRQRIKDLRNPAVATPTAQRLEMVMPEPPTRSTGTASVRSSTPSVQSTRHTSPPGSPHIAPAPDQLNLSARPLRLLANKTKPLKNRNGGWHNLDMSRTHTPVAQ